MRGTRKGTPMKKIIIGAGIATVLLVERRWIVQRAGQLREGCVRCCRGCGHSDGADGSPHLETEASSASRHRCAC